MIMSMTREKCSSLSLGSRRREMLGLASDKAINIPIAFPVTSMGARCGRFAEPATQEKKTFK